MKSTARKILKILGTPVGNCYVASEAYYHINGGKAAGYKPFQAKINGISHWWLENERGRVIDITADQFDGKIDYAKGRGRGFLTKNPSKKAQAILNELRMGE